MSLGKTSIVVGFQLRIRYYFSAIPKNRLHRCANHDKERFGLGLAFVGLAVMCGISQFQNVLPNKIRNEVQTRLNIELNKFGLRASVRRAEFFEGKGIRLSDLRIDQQHSRDRNSVVEIHEAFIHAPSTLTELAIGDIKIHAVDFRGGKFSAIRNPEGDWQLAPLLKHFREKCASGQHDLSVRFNDCSLIILDRSTPIERVQKLRDINMVARPIIHENRKLIQITGDCSALAVSHVQFKAFVDPDQQTWFTEIKARNAQLTTELFTLLPTQTSSVFDDIQVLGGNLDLRGTANGDMSNRSLPQFSFSGELRNFSLSDRRIPLELKDCSVDFEISDIGFNVKRAIGQAGQGTFDLSYQQIGLFQRKAWSSAGRLIDFNFTEKIHPWLPDSCDQFCKDFQPYGTSNIDFQIAFDGQNYTRNLRSQITNMEFNFYKFPYPFRRCRGEVTWIDDDCKFEVRSQIGRQPFRIVGNANRPGRDSTYSIDVEAKGKFAIDEKLLDALDPYPDLKRQVLAFRPNGFVSGKGNISKSRADALFPNKSFDIELNNCNVNHVSFQYPIGNVNGMMRVRNENCSFENATGVSGNAQIRCDGDWNSQTGLDLRFLCRRVPFDETLRNALEPKIQEIWDDFRPRGAIGLLKVDMTLPVGENEADLVVDADLAMDEIREPSQLNGPPTSSVSIFPTWFPFEINQLKGRVEIGRGRITLTNMQGKHRRTWIDCQGNGVYSDQAWSVSLKNMLVGALEVEEDLLHALPEPLAIPLRNLDFQGILNVQGEITMGGTYESTAVAQASPASVTQVGYLIPEPEPSSTRMFWDLRLDMVQAAMLLGLPVNNVFGMVRLAGEYDGQTASCAGELAIDSLMLQGVQITNLRGPIWIDENGVSAGSLARRNQQSEPRQVIGKICDGQVRFDARKQSDENGKFYIQASLTDGCLRDLVSDFAPYVQHVTGKTYGAVRLTGDDTGTHSYRGEGTLQLRDAKIYELPLVVSLLKILRIKEVNRTAFDTSSVDFFINGSNFELNRIELIGDAISLIGNGQIYFNRKLDLNFYSVVGRNRFYIPLLSELYQAGSQRILWISIDGTLDQPITHRKILPQLNDTIRILLQPPERHAQFGNEILPGKPFVPINSPIGTNAFPIRR